MPETVFCPSCGAEYLAGVRLCADCNVPLGESVPGVGDDEVVYDLAEWSQQQRSQLELLLTGAGLTHRWEVGSDLIVLEADEAAIEKLMEEIEASWDAPPLPMSEADDGDDEHKYAVMSNLFVAADRLQKSPDDAATAGEFYQAADAVAETGAPFGIDVPEWRQVQELAASLAAAMETDVHDDVISRDAAALKALLARYV